MSKLNIFEHILAKKPKRSTFNLTHMNSLTCEMGKLIPIMCEEIVPGDTWKLKTDLFVRFAPLYAPVMHQIYATIHYFYVPWRILWDDYEDFITGGPLGNLRPQFPVIELADGRSGSDYYDTDGYFATGSLADYLNYPTSDSTTRGGGMHVSALPLRAYQMIYNDYYRDENLIEEVPFSLSSGVISYNSAEWQRLLTIRNRAWRKDYFTSALPWTQRGSQQQVPLTGVVGQTGNVPVTFSPINPSTGQFVPAGVVTGAGGGYSLESVPTTGISGNTASLGSSQEPGIADIGASTVNNAGNLYVKDVQVNLSDGSFNINDLRRANRIQQWLERQSRGGSRYIESEASHFGVVSDDLRLQRPEFLGGGVQAVQVSDVLQTSQTTSGEGGSPQASPAGIAFASGSKNGFKRTFKERGYIIGILSITPVPAYAEGLPIGYHKFDKFQFYWPEFATLGEQPIYNFELALRGDNIQDTFGYAPRYAEYKFIPDRVHGDFKTNMAFWNLARHFSEQPTLSGEFVTIDASRQHLNRIFNVEKAGASELDHLWVQIRQSITARRPMPYLPDPSL